MKLIDLPLLQFDRELDLQHYCERCHDAYQQRRDSPLCSIWVLSTVSLSWTMWESRYFWRFPSLLMSSKISIDCLFVPTGHTHTQLYSPQSHRFSRSVACMLFVCVFVSISVWSQWQCKLIDVMWMMKMFFFFGYFTSRTQTKNCGFVKWN